MKEIIRPTPELKYVEGVVCRSCGGRMVHGAVACPEGKLGCLVIHYGYTCVNCGKDFE